MSRWMRWVGYTVGGVVVLVGAVAGFVYASSSSKLKKTYDVPLNPFTVTSDSAIIVRGQHLATAINKCSDCHGPDFGGFMVIDDPALGQVAGPNLTPGAGSNIGAYTDAEIARVIRHGVLKNGRGAFLMPSWDYQFMTDEDLNAVIAFIRSLSPVDKTVTPVVLKPVGRALLAAGQLPIDADRVDHARVHTAAIVADSTVTYGEYLANIGGCTGCHGPTLSGGPIPGLPPDAPPAANLTPTGISHYSDAQLESILRTGARPDGSQLSEWMPWKSTALMTPVEMTATLKYLRTVAPKDFGGR